MKTTTIKEISISEDEASKDLWDFFLSFSLFQYNHIEGFDMYDSLLPVSAIKHYLKKGGYIPEGVLSELKNMAPQYEDAKYIRLSYMN